MKYKNSTKEPLVFRAHRIDGVKTSFKLEPNEQVDLYRDNLDIEGLEKIEKKVKKSKDTNKSVLGGD